MGPKAKGIQIIGFSEKLNMEKVKKEKTEDDFRVSGLGELMNASAISKIRNERG